ETLDGLPDELDQQLDVYVIVMGAPAQSQAFRMVEKLRDDLPALRLQIHCGDGSLKSQMKRADKSGATLALIVGEDELRTQTVTVKTLRDQDGSGGVQQQVAIENLTGFMAD